MTTNGAIPSLFTALVTASIASVAMAEGTATRPATANGSGPKPAHVAAAGSSADPFEDLSVPTKPGASPAVAAPPKPAASPAVAAPAKPAAPPMALPAQNLPSKELEAFMRALEGSWKCDTKFAAGSLGPGSVPLSARTDITIRREFGGFAWHGEFKLAKTATTSATSGVFQISYAAGTKQATFLSYDSVGSAMMGAGALGGDSVTFAEEGFLKGEKVKVRETLTAKGPRRLYHKVEIKQANGYQAMAEDTCSK